MVTNSFRFLTFLILAFFFVCSCKKNEDINNEPENTEGPKLIFKVKIDGDQQRLDNLGQPAGIPQGNAAQTPVFNTIAAHYIELSQSAFVQVGEGEVLYHAPETDQGGDLAIDFSQSNIVENGETMFSTPLANLAPGSYQYARVSIVYQNYDVEFRANDMDFQATLASFVGYNTYISTHTVNQMEDQVNGNRLQGYWAWETHSNQFLPEPILETGQAPATTVPNPIAGTSPIPSGSCLVTGEIENELLITGDETSDIIVELSFSVNNSFEWEDTNGNDLFEPLDGESVVDMGLRGLIAKVLP
jgi:hypothetical protein